MTFRFRQWVPFDQEIIPSIFVLDFAEIYSSSTTGTDIHYRMLATMVLLTFLLKCCVMIQQEGIMQDVYTFAGTDQCQLPEYGPYSYICKSSSRTICFEPIHFSNNYDRFAQRKLLLSSDIELHPGPTDMDTVPYRLFKIKCKMRYCIWFTAPV